MYIENEKSNDTDEETVISTLFNVLQAEMMLENLSKMLQALDRAEGEKIRNYEREIEKISQKDLDEKNYIFPKGVYNK